MTQYEVTYQCGHTVSEQLYGPHADRERRSRAAKSRRCPDCSRAEQTRRAAEATADLPTLTGTPKQIAWATRIRAAELAEVDQMIAELRAKQAKAVEAQVPAETLARNERVLALVDQAAAELRQTTSSNAWIEDYRSSSVVWVHDRARELRGQEARR